eukprot:scaffold135475_cov15-Tisochrysis_lutea.AAC.1
MQRGATPEQAQANSSDLQAARTPRTQHDCMYNNRKVACNTDPVGIHAINSIKTLDEGNMFPSPAASPHTLCTFTLTLFLPTTCNAAQQALSTKVQGGALTKAPGVVLILRRQMV